MVFDFYEINISSKKEKETKKLEVKIRTVNSKNSMRFTSPMPIIVFDSH